jgi:hypothetical protein
MRRTDAFKKDLDHFYANDGQWKIESESRPAVQKYIEHLKKVKSKKH